jgi:hypothetical protein
LVLQMVRAKDGILKILMPGHRAPIVSTVLASVGGCAPHLLSFGNGQGNPSPKLRRAHRCIQRRIGVTCPAELLVPKFGTVCQMGQLLKGLQSFRHRANKALGVRSFIRSTRIEGRSGLRTHEPYSEPPNRICEQRCIP